MRERSIRSAFAQCVQRSMLERSPRAAAPARPVGSAPERPVFNEKCRYGRALAQVNAAPQGHDRMPQAGGEPDTASAHYGAAHRPAIPVRHIGRQCATQSARRAAHRAGTAPIKLMAAAARQAGDRIRTDADPTRRRPRPRWRPLYAAGFRRGRQTFTHNLNLTDPRARDVSSISATGFLLQLRVSLGGRLGFRFGFRLLLSFGLVRRFARLARFIGGQHFGRFGA